MATKKKQATINDTDHEIETPEGWIIPSKNYSPRLSSYHQETEKYILKRDGFQDVIIRKMLNEWEYLAYKYPSTGDEVWKKIDMDLFSEEAIREQIEKYGVKNENN